jgi:hypothetical protein
MTITTELRQAIERAGDDPVRIEDPDTHTAYVLVKAEVFERMQSLAEVEEIDPSFFEFDDDEDEDEPGRENPR